LHAAAERATGVILCPDRIWLNGRFVRGFAVELNAGTGRIERVAKMADYEGDSRVRQMPGRALLPGFVNAHSHSFQRLIRGRTQWRTAARTADFWSWREAMYAAALSLGPDDVYHAARFCFIEMLRAGYTSVGEFHYLHNAPDGTAYDEPGELALRVIAAATDAGIRIRLLNVAYAAGGIGQPLAPEQRRFGTPDLDAYLAGTQHLIDGLRGSPLASVGVAPHSVRAVPREWIRPLHDFAAQHDLPFHVHASEQPAEVEACLAAYGVRPVQLLASERALDKRVTLVHATHLSKAEIALIGKARATVAACPTTERDLGDGILEAGSLLAAGAGMAIGSDSQTIIAPLEEIRLIEYHERLRSLRRIVITGGDGALRSRRAAGERRVVAPSLIGIGTRGGARSLRLPTGDIQAGAFADLIAIDLDHESLAGATEDDVLAAALALSAPPSVVSDVWVHGRCVVQERAHADAGEAARAFSKVVVS
jgi:formimidoylglutamate deiminase